MPNDVKTSEVVEPAAAAEETKPAAKGKKNRKSRSEKILLIVGIVLAVLDLLLILAVVFRDPLIKFSVDQVGSWLTGTNVRMGYIDTSLFKGYVRVRDFAVDNPDGYSAEKKAIKLGEAYVSIRIGSLFTKKIEVEEVNVDGLHVYCQVNTSGMNLLDILNHIKMKTESKKKKKTKKAESDVEVVIRHLKVSDSSVDSNFSFPISLNMEKRDIGEKGGSSWKDLWNEIVGKFKLPDSGWFKKLF